MASTDSDLGACVPVEMAYHAAFKRMSEFLAFVAACPFELQPAANAIWNYMLHVEPIFFSRGAAIDALA